MASEALTYTSQIDFLEAIFSQAASGDFAAASGGYARLSDVKATVQRLLETAQSKKQEDRVAKLVHFQEQIQAQVAKLAVEDERKILLFRGTALLDSSTSLSASLASSKPSEAYSTSSSSSSAASSSSFLSQLSLPDEFLQLPFTCPICFLELPLRETTGFRRCEHRYCRGCMEQYLQVTVQNNNSAITCPTPGCSAEAEERDMRECASEETYQRFLNLLVLAIVENDVNMRWCPNEHCSHPIIIENRCREVQAVQCPSCQCAFCTGCGNKTHPDTDCAGAALPTPDQLFQTWLLQKGARVKSCFHCKALTEKNEGCNHMTCNRCAGQWCWICGEAFISGHFSEGTCDGLQFSHISSLAELAEHRRIAALSEEERRAHAGQALREAMELRRRQLDEAETNGGVVSVTNFLQALQHRE